MWKDTYLPHCHTVTLFMMSSTNSSFKKTSCNDARNVSSTSFTAPLRASSCVGSIGSLSFTSPLPISTSESLPGFRVLKRAHIRLHKNEKREEMALRVFSQIFLNGRATERMTLERRYGPGQSRFQSMVLLSRATRMSAAKAL